jgi:hypothetical protein
MQEQLSRSTQTPPFILNIVTLAHPCARDIPFILNIVTLAHPCARDIPFILNIKKAVKK